MVPIARRTRFATEWCFDFLSSGIKPRWGTAPGASCKCNMSAPKRPRPARSAEARIAVGSLPTGLSIGRLLSVARRRHFRKTPSTATLRPRTSATQNPPLGGPHARTPPRLFRGRSHQPFGESGRLHAHTKYVKTLRRRQEGRRLEGPLWVDLCTYLLLAHCKIPEFHTLQFADFAALL